MLQAIFDEILTKRQDDLTRKHGGRWAKNNPTPADLSPCARETALAILHWQERPPLPEHIYGMLSSGEEAENRNIAKLLQLGFSIIEQQRMFELRDTKGRIVLRGKIDGKLKHPSFKYPIPFDHKEINPIMFARLNTMEDFFRFPFYTKYPKQLWSYCYLDDSETSFIWLSSQGNWKLIEFPFDPERFEPILKQCEAAVESVSLVRDGFSEEDALPPYHQNLADCQKCWARGRVCFPPALASNNGEIKVIEDEDLALKIARREELEDAADEYATLDKQIKSTVQEQNNLIVGNYFVTGKWQTKNYKAQPAKEAHTLRYWVSKIERIAQS